MYFVLETLPLPLELHVREPARGFVGVIMSFDGKASAKRQTICAWSAFEAELDAAANTSQTGVHLQRTLEGILDRKLDMILFSDNAACVINLVRDDGACMTARTRAVGIRCSYLRDQCVAEGFDIRHMAGAELPADPLTKVLKRSELAEARKKVGLVLT